MINYQRIYFKFSQLIKQMLFYISCKICNHSLISIDFIASVYELFDNPSYIFFFAELLNYTCIYCEDENWKSRGTAGAIFDDVFKFLLYMLTMYNPPLR